MPSARFEKHHEQSYAAREIFHLAFLHQQLIYRGLECYGWSAQNASAVPLCKLYSLWLAGRSRKKSHDEGEITSWLWSFGRLNVRPEWFFLFRDFRSVLVSFFFFVFFFLNLSCSFFFFFWYLSCFGLFSLFFPVSGGRRWRCVLISFHPGVMQSFVFRLGEASLHRDTPASLSQLQPMMLVP